MPPGAAVRPCARCAARGGFGRSCGTCTPRLTPHRSTPRAQSRQRPSSVEEAKQGLKSPCTARRRCGFRALIAPCASCSQLNKAAASATTGPARRPSSYSTEPQLGAAHTAERTSPREHDRVARVAADGFGEGAPRVASGARGQGRREGSHGRSKYNNGRLVWSRLRRGQARFGVETSHGGSFW